MHAGGQLEWGDVTSPCASWAPACPQPRTHLVAACLMNCLAGCFQMAGTVMTHLTSEFSNSEPAWSLSSWPEQRSRPGGRTGLPQLRRKSRFLGHKLLGSFILQPLEPNQHQEQESVV